MRPFDGAGHHPGKVQPGESPAERLLSIVLETQELAYQLAEQLGVSREDLDARAQEIARQA